MKNCQILICLTALAWAGSALADSATAIRQLAQHLALRKADPKGYIHHVQIHRGLGHWMNRRDAVAVP